MNEHDGDRDPLERLAERFTRQCRSGSPPSIEVLAEEHAGQGMDVRPTARSPHASNAAVARTDGAGQATGTHHWPVVPSET
jgi:hypothetical protein